IEWNAVSDEEEDADNGRITGYDLVSDLEGTDSFRKGSENFKTGDRISFLFDYYDENGELVKTDTYGGTVIVSKKENLKVTDEPLEDGDIQFHGVLTDVYQRQIMTEVVDAHIGD
ncbi:MAG: hypothetical protein IJ227_00520, partial [Mogibacterium sp.]|nr:hypothetical protein [Mogibacterium sp.]